MEDLGGGGGILHSGALDFRFRRFRVSDVLSLQLPGPWSKESKVWVDVEMYKVLALDL